MHHIVFCGLSGIAKRTRACDARLAFLANMLAKSYDITDQSVQPYNQALYRCGCKRFLG